MNRSVPARPLVDRRLAAANQWRAFSLWCPTALQRLYCRLHLAEGALELGTRRVIVLTGLAWLPLLLLSAIGGRAANGVHVAFALDFDLQARLLVVLPLLIAGEVVIHRRMPATVRQFVERRIVTGSERARFDVLVSSALSLSRSPLVDCLLIAGVYAIDGALTGSISTLPGTSWYGTPAGNSVTLTSAGWWYVIVSRPLFQYVLLRWYFRGVVWSRFLWQVSRLRLHLVATHPDRHGGAGFVFGLSDAFAPFLFAHGAMLAGRVANGVVYDRLTLASYTLELVAVPACAVLFVLAAEFSFAMTLWKVKRKGLADYGRLSQRYVREFDHKWTHSTPVFQSLLGNADVQSLADLMRTYDAVRQMRVLPTKANVATLLGVSILPLAPLILTVVPDRAFLERIVKMIL
jgi:hypothetical protein